MKKKKENKFVYCDNRKCADTTCQRWYKNAPFDELILINRFELTKDGACKHKL